MTDNIVMEAVGELKFSVVVAWAVGIAAILVAVILLGIRIYKVIEKYRKGRNHLENKQQDFEKMKESIDSIIKSQKFIQYALQKLLAYRLDEQIKIFYKLSYIPYDDFSIFQSCFNAYEGVGGNGEMREKYLKCLDDLECK